jgi:hypothetical protein
MTNPVYTCRQYRLLITGSRQATPEMLQMARRAVARAKAQSWMVLVGDNPQGVDAAVIDACDELGVNVLVCGTAPQPRKGSQRLGSYWRVDVKQRNDGEFSAFGAYAARDRWIVEMCDQMLALWNGQSRGTKAGYDYARQVKKHAHLITFDRPKKPSPRQPETHALHIVELVVDAAEKVGAEPFEGVYGLRALHSPSALLYDVTGSDKVDVHMADAARMQMLITALERLTVHLKGEQAGYRLRVFQSSKYVEGWCAKGWRRPVPEVQRLASRIDALLKRFPDVEWVKMPRAQVKAKLNGIGKGGVARR